MKEDPLSLQQVCRLIYQLTKRKPHVSTVHRWIHSGVKDRRLRARRVGGRWLVEHKDLREFLDPPGERDARSNPSSEAADQAVSQMMGRSYGKDQADGERF